MFFLFNSQLILNLGAFKEVKNKKNIIDIIGFNLKKLDLMEIKMNYNNKEFDDILSRMPETFLNDKKRPEFSSLPVLQRIGKLDKLGIEKDEFFKRNANFCEIDHEFRFFSLQKTLSKNQKLFFITLGLNKEDELINLQKTNTKEFKSLTKSTTNQKKTQKEQKISRILKKLTFTTVFISRSSPFYKLWFSVFLIILSILSSI